MIQSLPFIKMHGLGNDYVYIDCFRDQTAALMAQADLSALSVRMSNRHTGIGSDGIVLMMPSRTADVRMRMFNADGSEAEMCGNAVRCIARYAYGQGLCGNPMTIETQAGVKELSLRIADNGSVEQVTVNMGKPAAKQEQLAMDDRIVPFVQVDMGNPHAVIFTDTPLDEIPLADVGPLWEHHPRFAQRTNVEFVRVRNNKEVDVRVWERGTGETMACGTGACASVVAAVLCHLTDTSVTVHLTGGDLLIEWDRRTGDLHMSGTATEVFRGEYILNE